MLFQLHPSASFHGSIFSAQKQIKNNNNNNNHPNMPLNIFTVTNNWKKKIKKERETERNRDD